MLRYMLDTNLCMATIRNKPETIRAAFNRHHTQMFINTVNESRFGNPKARPSQEGGNRIQALRKSVLPAHRQAGRIELGGLVIALAGLINAEHAAGGVARRLDVLRRRDDLVDTL